MRLFIILISCGLAINGQAQNSPKTLRIQLSYEKAGQYIQQAVETIEAVNIIGSTSTVEYKAGRSIELLSGFEAKAGSTFTANIKPVETISDFTLSLTAYPNPFEQSTKIEYILPANGKVNLWIINAQGKKIGQLITEESQSAGKHEVEWNPGYLETGTYIPILEANQQKATGRIIKK